MNNKNLKNIAENLIDTFLEAGRIAKKISERGVKITIKADKSPVTDGDLAVDKILKEKIKTLTPNISIVSEETVNPGVENKDKDFWLIDPIDGTRDYINKKEEYTLNAAPYESLLRSLRFPVQEGPVVGPARAPRQENTEERKTT